MALNLGRVNVCEPQLIWSSISGHFLQHYKLHTMTQSELFRYSSNGGYTAPPSPHTVIPTLPPGTATYVRLYRDLIVT